MPPAAGAHATERPWISFAPESARDPYRLPGDARRSIRCTSMRATGAYVLSRYEDVRFRAEEPRLHDAQLRPPDRAAPRPHGSSSSTASGACGAAQPAWPCRSRAVNIRQRFLADRGDGEEAHRTPSAWQGRGRVSSASSWRISPWASSPGPRRLPPGREGPFPRGWYTSLLRFGLNLTGDPEAARAGFCRSRPSSTPICGRSSASGAGAGDDLLSMLSRAPRSKAKASDDDEICRFGMLMISPAARPPKRRWRHASAISCRTSEQLAAVRNDRSLVGARRSPSRSASPRQRTWCRGGPAKPSR